jgi:membrane protein implicated in regulation of membrane protease activity
VISQVLYWYWWSAAAVLGIAEILLPGAFFLWLALAAVVTGAVLLAVPDLGAQFQLLIFAVSSVASWVFGRRFVRRHLATTDQPDLNRRGEHYIGQRFALTEPISGGLGRSKVGDSVWTVEGPEDLAAGTLVTVVGVRGIRLQVEKVS